MKRHCFILATAIGLFALCARTEVVNVTQGSTSNYTMTDGNTYIIQDSVCFSNRVAGGNGITIEDGATVVIYIPTNVTLTAIGADSDGQIGGGAGIYVPSNATLVVTGEGTLNAMGGKAGDGGDGKNGANGGDITISGQTYSPTLTGKSGPGGKGGNGGGGAGCGIGGIGGAGGNGGNGAAGVSGGNMQTPHNGTAGGKGGDGLSGSTMGSVYVIGKVSVIANSGLDGSNGRAGTHGSSKGKKPYEGSSDYPFVTSGGGGGGGGGAGAAPLFNIGGGGSSGGGGGGGGSGGTLMTSSSSSAYGGGGVGGGSEAVIGESGAARGSVSSSGKTVYGGNGGAAGSKGAAGGNGELFVASTVSISTTRQASSTNTHHAAEYSISFNLNGAPLPAVAPVVATLGVTLPQAAVIAQPGFHFLGWTTEGEGGICYYDANGNALLPIYSTPAPVTLYAQWRLIGLGENFFLDSDFNYVWHADDGNTFRSAAIPDGTNSWMNTVVTGPGKLSFDWKVSCENRYAYLQVLIDGVQQKRITGEKDWESLLYEIGSGEHEIMWNYVKDGAAAVGEDAGFVRNISWRPYLAFSSETAHGLALPADNDGLLYGDVVEATVDASVTDGDVRYDCIGWRGTGSAPAEGVSNACAFVLREDSSLAWLWRTNYWTTLSVEGPATADFSEAWLEAGSVRTVAVAPSVPYYAIALSGDTAGVALDSTNVVIVADEPRELTVSVRELTLAGALGTTNLAWRTGGDSVWFPEAQVSADGLDAAQSGALDSKGAGWIETTVIGPGTLSFKWRFAPGGANSGIDFLIDGDYEDGLTDATDGWEDCTVEIGAGRHVMRWEFYGSDGDNGTAWLDQLVWTGGHPVPTYTAVNVTGPATADFTGGYLEDSSNMIVRIMPEVDYWRITLEGDTEGVTLDGTVIAFEVNGPRTINVLVEELTLETAVDSSGIKWRTDGNAVWFPETEASFDGEDAAQTGAVVSKGVSRLATTVIGPGTLNFHWKLSTGGMRSGLDILVDDEYEDSLENDTGWEAYTLSVGDGLHEIAWEFWNQGTETNCSAWLDAVSWNGDYPTATSTTPDPVPYVWLDANARPFVTRFHGDYEAAAHEVAANALNSVYECYVAGLCPTDANDVLRAVIAIDDSGAPRISWEPRLPAAEEAKRVYTVLGRDILESSEWGPTNAECRFFKVKVKMK